MTLNPVTVDRRDPRTFAIIGAGMEVHRELGPGFLELVYHDALALEFSALGIPFAREVELPVSYKGVPLARHYRADFLCYGEILVEIKAIRHLTSADGTQLIHYLVAGRVRRGLLINFGAPSLQYRRFVGPANRFESASVASV